ncbi:MAG: hypothetical protein ACI9NC_004693 [Verrucomicrobiales bacterium]
MVLCANFPHQGVWIVAIGSSDSLPVAESLLASMTCPGPGEDADAIIGGGRRADVEPITCCLICVLKFSCVSVRTASAAEILRDLFVIKRFTRPQIAV